MFVKKVTKKKKNCVNIWFGVFSHVGVCVCTLVLDCFTNLVMILLHMPTGGW